MMQTAQFDFVYAGHIKPGDTIVETWFSSLERHMSLSLVIGVMPIDGRNIKLTVLESMPVKLVSFEVACIYRYSRLRR